MILLNVICDDGTEPAVVSAFEDVACYSALIFLLIRYLHRFETKTVISSLTIEDDIFSSWVDLCIPGDSLRVELIFTVVHMARVFSTADTIVIVARDLSDGIRLRSCLDKVNLLVLFANTVVREVKLGA